MTDTLTFPANALPKGDILGPFSPWPRRKTVPYRRVLIRLGQIGALVVFAHCVLPAVV